MKSATLVGALGNGGNSRAGAKRLKEIGEPAPCICNLGGECDTLCVNRQRRQADPDKVRLRAVEFTADQLLLKKVIEARLPDICADAETGIALLSYCLSELILRTARPGMLPEAVATAVQVLRYNCGVAQPVPVSAGYTTGKRCPTRLDEWCNDPACEVACVAR